MKDISIKNRIIAVASFLLVALILTVRSAWPFTFVFFGGIGLVLFFADKIISNEKIHNRTVFAFCIFGTCYQTFYQIFNHAHETGKQTVIVLSITVFLAAVLALTDKNKLVFATLAAPLLCITDIRIAICYAVLLLSFSFVILGSDKTESPKKSKSKSRIDKRKLPFLSAVLSVACIVIGIYLSIKSQGRGPERIDHLFFYFKNTLGFLVAAVYLSVKIFRHSFRAKSAVLLGIVLNVVSIIFLTATYGWTIFSLSCVSLDFFLLLCCMESADITQAIKTDYHNNKYLFYTGFLLMLI